MRKLMYVMYGLVALFMFILCIISIVLSMAYAMD